MQNFINWLNTLNKPNLPKNVEQLQNARDLDLSNSNITQRQISNVISLCRNLPNLKGINLANNDIKSLPDEFGKLHIEKLGLYNNYNLQDIGVIENLSHLKFLVLNGKKRIELPKFPNSLKELYLQNTHQSNLSTILEANNLEVLDISRNEFCIIDELQRLPNLRQIIVDSKDDIFSNITIPNWLETDDWRCEKRLVEYYFKICIFTRKER